MILETELCDFPEIFLKFWSSEPRFLINLFLVKKSILYICPILRTADGHLYIFSC